jgi:Cu/Ag efflux pump CusA
MAATELTFKTVPDSFLFFLSHSIITFLKSPLFTLSGKEGELFTYLLLTFNYVFSPKSRSADRLTVSLTYSLT